MTRSAGLGYPKLIRFHLVWTAIAFVLSASLFAQQDQPELIGSALVDARNPIAKLFSGERVDLWSLKPIADPLGSHPVRSADRQGVLSHPIDGLIPEAVESLSKEQLLQRMSLDLIGLRATYEERTSFLEDDSIDATDKLVDRLMSDPRFGEHWARFWLDAVRYSDSNGFDWDEYRKEAWRYRDFVVRAFNEDLPYDQFVLWQLAGDELLDRPPQSQAQLDRLIATGYLRLGPFDNAAKLFNEQDRARAEVLTDLTETTGSAFLGLTLSCCRCHHHKTDPLSHQDHYRFRAFFAALEFDDTTPVLLSQEQQAIEKHNQAIDAKIQPLEARLEASNKATQDSQEESKVESKEDIKKLKQQIDQLRVACYRQYQKDRHDLRARSGEPPKATRRSPAGIPKRPISQSSADRSTRRWQDHRTTFGAGPMDGSAR
jgi:hypothetical protein